MLKELVLSVVSGVVVALILQIFRFGGSRSAPAPRQNMRYGAPPARRGGSFIGGFMRFGLAVVGGIVAAQSLAPFVLGRRFRDYGDYDRFDRFDGFGGLAQHAPILILTVISTIVIWALLSALRRR
jgi:hypothetical protein